MDRQTDRWTDRQTDGQTDRQTDRETDRQKDTLTVRQTLSWTERQTERQTERETERQRDRQTDRHEDRQGHTCVLGVGCSVAKRVQGVQQEVGGVLVTPQRGQKSASVGMGSGWGVGMPVCGVVREVHNRATALPTHQTQRRRTQTGAGGGHQAHS